MMPHIIYLLLIASSPIYTLGDGPESWGNIPSGPSESECRPYIEKALQGASIQESPEQQPGIDDVGDTGQREESIAASEVSESQSSEIPSDVEGAGLSEAEESQQENPETETNEESSVEDAIEGSEKSDTEISEEAQEEQEKSEDISGEIPNEPTETPEKEPAESSENDEAEEQSGETKDDKTILNVENESNVNESDETLEISSIEDTTKEEPSEEDQTPAEPEVAREGKAVDDSSEGTQQNDQNEELVGDESNVSQETPSAEEADSKEDKETLEEAPAEESSGEQEGIPSTLDESTESQVVEGEASEEQAEEVSVSAHETEQHSEPIEPSELSSQVATEEIKEGDSEEVKEENSAATEETESEENPSEIESGVESAEVVDKLEEVQSEEVSETSEISPIDESLQASAEETGKPASGEGSKEEGTVAAEEGIAESAEEETPTQVEESTSEEPVATEEPPAPEEELSMIIEMPEKLRPREHMSQILLLNEDNEEMEKLLSKTIDNTLRELKKLYDNAIKPLEILYKYRDLSNRHFGDPEIFSKPLILFMGPWSGGKSTIINYLLENEYKRTALRSGAEPSPAYFNIVMWGEREEVLDGTQLAADWTFSGLQKFGQGLLDRLRGLKLSHPLLEKVNIVEIPGILEIRKQVERLFPFNDACQWFIDRADIIFLVYDPSKLDVGPETEAILDQLKGREMQTRIILNKADQVKPEELMRVQGTLIWNISPLMSSTEPPVMYSTSLWSLPYEVGAPTRLLHAQERAFLKDLRDAIDKRVENKIASARRFSVRVRNHAKMVDCYLTTYYNHKSFFGNKKKISDDIIEHPQNYHIYEGLSTLTNISRYDLPDPDVYRDFFRLNPVYEFQQLSSTCTYFRGCPINRLDVAIAYDLPELVGKYKKQADDVLNSVKK